MPCYVALGAVLLLVIVLFFVALAVCDPWDNF